MPWQRPLIRWAIYFGSQRLGWGYGMSRREGLRWFLLHERIAFDEIVFADASIRVVHDDG